MRTSRSRLALVAMALTLALAGAACSSDDETATPSDDTTSAPSGPACGAVPGEGPGSFDGLASVPVATAAASSKLLTTLATAVTDAGLVDTLNGDGPFTVFAPANSAFGEIPASDLDALLGDKEALTDVLTYHVVEGAYTPDELIEAGTVDSIQGQPLTIAEDGDNLTVDGAKVLCGNIPVENGVVYVIDEVLQPDTDATPVSGPVGPLCQAIPADAVASLADLPVGDAAGERRTARHPVHRGGSGRPGRDPERRRPVHRLRSRRGRVRRRPRRHPERPARRPRGAGRRAHLPRGGRRADRASS